MKWIMSLIILLIISGCKQNTVYIRTHNTDMLIEQIVLSSVVYNTHYSLPDSIEPPILIYRYSDLMCEGCVFEDLENLKDFQKEIGKDRILVLADFNNFRINMVRHRYELESFNYRILPTKSLIIPVNETEGLKPYFALLNSDFKLEMVFFPKKGFNEITQAYLKEVEKRLL